MTIPERILKLADFDELYWMAFKIYPESAKEVAREEHTRLLPLIKSLAEIIEKQSEALAFYNRGATAQRAIADTQSRLKELGCGDE